MSNLKRFSALGSRRETIAAVVAERAGEAKSTGPLEDAVLMMAAASLIADDPTLMRIPAECHELVRRIITPKREITLWHNGSVNSASFSPDGTRILTASDDKTARIWDASSGVQISSLVGHDHGVNAATFSPDGKRIVTASEDRTARIWDAVSGAEIGCLAGHEGPVNGAAFSSDGTRIVTASYDDTARIWDAATGAERACLRGHGNGVTSAAFSPDGGRIVTSSGDKTARIWDAMTGAELACLGGHENGVTSASFSPDGTRIVTASYDDTARIWDAATGAELVCLSGHGNSVTSAAFSADGMRVVTASSDKTGRIWEAATGGEIACLSDHQETANSAAFSPNGTRIVTASLDGTARIWDMAPAVEIGCLAGHNGELKSAAFSPDGLLIATASGDGTARIWDAVTGAAITSLVGHDSSVASARFSPDGRFLVTASSDRTARIWDAATGNEKFCLRGHEDEVNSAAFSPDGSLVVTASADNTACIWDAESGAEITRLSGHDYNVSRVAFSPDGMQIVTASDDETARIWDVFTGAEVACLGGFRGSVLNIVFNQDGARVATTMLSNAYVSSIVQIWDVATGAKIVSLSGHAWGVGSAVFSPDGTRILTVSDDNIARIWDAVTGAELACVLVHNDEVINAAFSPDGSLIVTASDDNTARIWDVGGTAEYEPIHTLPCGELSVRSVAEAGGVLATACGNGVQLWHVLSGERIGLLEGHDQLVRSLAFSPDGSMLGSASRDGSWRLWDRAGGSRLAKADAHGGAGLWSLVFSPDGTQLLTCGGDGTARIWEAGSGNELSVLRGHQGEVFLAAFALDGTRVVTFGEDTTAAVWSAADGTRLRIVDGDVTAMTVSPDGKLFATGHADGRVGVWCPEGGPEPGLIEGLLAGSVRTIEFSPDGARVLTWSEEGVLCVTEVASASVLALARSGAVVSARFSPDGTRIICAHEDGSATVHDAASGRHLARLRGHRAGLNDARYVLDGMRIVTVSDDHCAILWEGGRVGGDWGSCLSYGQRRAILRLGLAAAGISTDIPGDSIEGIDDEPDMYGEYPHAQTVRAVLEQAMRWSGNEVFAQLVRYFPDEQVPKAGIRDREAGDAIIRCGQTIADLYGFDAFQSFSWAFPVQVRKVPAATCDRTRPMFAGPLFTSDDYPWPEGLEPIVQFYLGETGRLGGVDLGEGLLQLWLPEYSYGDDYIIRVIPLSEISGDRLTPPPEEALENRNRFGGYEAWPAGPDVYESTRCSEGVLTWDEEIYDHKGTGSDLIDALMHFLPPVRSNLRSPAQAPHFFGHCQPVQYSLSDRPPLLLALESDNIFTWGDNGNAQIFYETQPDGSVKFSFKWSCG